MRKLNFTTLRVIAVIAAVLLLLPSCENTDNETQVFDDCFDITGVVELNDKITSASSVEELEVLFDHLNVSAQVEKSGATNFTEMDSELPQIFAEISLSEFISELESDLVISSSEKDLLLKNDLTTFENVIARFGSVITELEQNGFESESLDLGDSYTLKIIETPYTYYANDYYNGLLEVKSFIEDQVLSPLKALESLETEKSATLSACSGCTLISFLMAHEINNLCELIYWIKYWLENGCHNGGGGGD